MKTFVLAAVIGLASCYSNATDLKMTVVVDSGGSGQMQSPTSRAAMPPGAERNDSATIYVHGATQRVEFFGTIAPQRLGLFHYILPPNNLLIAGHRIAVLTHCDSGVVDELDLDSKTYREFKVPRYLSENDFRRNAERARKAWQKETTASTIDTGETRDVFGHVARHRVTTIVQKTRGSRVSSVTLRKDIAYTEVTFYRQIEYRETIDGWYVDLPAPGCAPEYLRGGTAVPATYLRVCDQRGPRLSDTCNPFPSDEIRVPHEGVELRGWRYFQAYSPVAGPSNTSVPLGIREVTEYDSGPANSGAYARTYLIYTGFLPAGIAVAQKTTGEMTLVEDSPKKAKIEAEEPWESRVTEYSEEPLDPALFTIPAGFKKIH